MYWVLEFGIKFNARYHYLAIQQGLKAIAVQAREWRSIASALMDARVRDNLQQKKTRLIGEDRPGALSGCPIQMGGNKELGRKLFGKLFNG